MQYIKWKSLVITSLVCLLPILFGIFVWDKLPETMAIHFNIHNEPDNFASKGFVVFFLPVFMMLMQIFCCFVNDFQTRKYGKSKKVERVVKWIIPFMSIVLQIATIAFSMGKAVDIRKVAVLIVGVVFLLTGNYMPKLNYVKNWNVDTEKARKINRFLGIETVIMGVLFIISIFLPPIYSLSCLFLLIPYIIIGVAYGTIQSRKK